MTTSTGGEIVLLFASRGLQRAAVVAKNATTAADGKTYQVEYFNLDAILLNLLDDGSV